MLRKEQDGLIWLEFHQLQPYKDQIEHAIFLKGSSAFPCVYSAKQCHGTSFAYIDSTSPLVTQNVDALITYHKEIPLGIKHADCQSAILFDPKKEILAMVHCGWRGNVQNIYQVIINEISSSPENLLVCIGPSLGPAFSEFRNYKTEFPKNLWKYSTENNQQSPLTTQSMAVLQRADAPDRDKSIAKAMDEERSEEDASAIQPELGSQRELLQNNHFNLWDIAYDQLINAGVAPYHIEIAKIDTFANENDFFSYRRNNTTNRHLTVAKMKL